MIRKFSFVIFLIVLATLFQLNNARALTSAPDGITVSPALQQINLSSKEPQTTAQFSITNNTSSPTTLNLSINDFNTLDESGGLFFVGTNPTQLQQKYGLAKWASLPTNQVTVGPKQSTNIAVNVLNQSSLLPGGHYGALMIAINANGQTGTSNNVNVHPVASALMFVTKLGGDTHKLELKNIVAKHSLFRLPNSVQLNFHNSGNTHLTPRGVVSVLSPSGKLLGKGIVNENSNLILPEANRLIIVPLTKIDNPIWPGRYKLKVALRFDGLEQTTTYEVKYLVIPGFSIWLIVIFAVGLAVIIIKHRQARQTTTHHKK